MASAGHGRTLWPELGLLGLERSYSSSPRMGWLSGLPQRLDSLWPLAFGLPSSLPVWAYAGLGAQLCLPSWATGWSGGTHESKAIRSLLTVREDSLSTPCRHPTGAGDVEIPVNKKSASEPA